MTNVRRKYEFLAAAPLPLWEPDTVLRHLATSSPESDGPVPDSHASDFSPTWSNARSVLDPLYRET